MEEIGGRASLVLFAPLLDVVHRLELNRLDGLSVQEGSCIVNSRHFLLHPLSPLLAYELFSVADSLGWYY